MTESLLSQLTSSIAPSTISEIATRLRVPEQAVSRGLSLSSATVFGAMANKSSDRGAMQQIIDVASRTTDGTIASAVSAGQLADPASSLMSSGRSVLSSFFGENSKWAADLIGRESGLGAGVTGAIMALGAHSVLSYIGSRVRDGRMNASSLALLLNNEAPTMRRLLPASFEDAFRTYFPRSEIQRIDVNPVVAQSVRKERSYLPWVAAAALLAGILAFGMHGLRRPQSIEPLPLPSLPVGTSGIVTTDLGRVTASMPNVGGLENRLLAFITSSRALDGTTWFDFDRLHFDTGSATLRPESREQLESIATILKTHPNARLKIGGYTDNVGSSADNLNLSEARASHVRNQLIGMGVDADRLTAEGYGETHPVGDNSTDVGRAMNRRVSMLVTAK